MYRRTAILILFFIAFSGSGKAQDSSNAKTAKLYFLRWTGAGGQLWDYGAFSTFIDDELACHLNNDRYTIHSVSPGLHKLQVRFNGNKTRKRISTLDLEMEAGQTYYVSLDVTGNYLTVKLDLMEVPLNTAKRLLPKLKEDTNCK